MATKGKDKILDGQIAFDFLSEIEVVKPEKKQKKVIKEKEVEPKVEKIVQVKTFRKAILNIKRNHFKKSRKVKRVPRKFNG